MKLDEKITQRLRELIEMGDRVLGTKKQPPRGVIGFDSSVSSQDAYQWFTSAQNLLVRVFGSDSEHYKNFSAQNARGLTYSPVLRAQGILKAALEDFQQDQLFELRQLVQAEIFDDFLEQAQELLSAGYFAPAAVVAGSVLEDGLRKLCQKHGVTLPAKPKLDRMNADLAKAGAYGKLTQKRITAIADVRNNAAHGNWDKFDQDDVEDAVKWIRKFMEDHFS